jgi:CSLREA domain-containing protein
VSPAVPRSFAVPALIAILACWATPCSADDIYVTITADTNDGFCGGPLHLPCSLRDAVISANARPGHDTIHVPAGFYNLTIAGTNEDNCLTGDLDILDDVTIFGGGADSTLINLTYLDRAVETFGTSYVQIYDVSINNGDGHGSNGGGILHYSSGMLILGRCVINGCVAQGASGGGICAANGPLVVQDSTLSSNHADHGAAIALYSGGGPLTLRRSTITNNYGLSSVRGGAVLVASAGGTIESSTIYANNGDNGAVVVRALGALTIESSTLADNSHYAIFNATAEPGFVTLRNNIIKGQCAGYNYSTEGGNVGDPADQCGLVNPGDYTFVPIYLHPLGDYGGPTPTMPPVYVANDGNLAIDNGWADANCLVVDQRGMNRPRDGNGDGVAQCDSGAVEVDFDGLPFTDGFESGDTSMWSAAVP